MKRVILLFLTILYFGNSTGFAMHFHYCLDRLVDANLVHSNLEVEGCQMHTENSGEENGDCCKDEIKSPKDDPERLSAESSLKLMQDWAISGPSAFYDLPDFLKLPIRANDFPVGNDPPIEKTVPVYLRNCVFRI